MGNNKKSEQLGMSFSTATNRLRKHIMFQLVQQSGRDECFQCGQKIESVDNLSIEHKDPWMYTDDPYSKFFDLDNIAFSHSKCNFANRRRRQDISSDSGYRGVSLTTDRNRKKPWKANCSINDKVKHIGYYASAKEAAEGYDKFVIENLGENTPTNKSLGLLD
ncbi:TPA: hypothetical protein QCR36_003902 [Bacillus cereus]|nr:hypothetical protein [Bacillus cereus]HDR4742374.1 hypothetical protein [Bacillus cereus]HDR4747961.1 hypothetical protein [Bacillus cereus]HDR4753435.1 hypothetical protein [Bacillus cereus]HDR4770644.1 hypothetical protein [Bacillus cereus]